MNLHTNHSLEGKVAGANALLTHRLQGGRIWSNEVSSLALPRMTMLWANQQITYAANID
jgi:hypothetical protein